jgi:hypothetical protein
MKALIFAGLLLAPVGALAASPEDAYLAARDRDIAALARIENAKDDAAREAMDAKATKDLEQRLKAIVGPFAAPGFAAEGKLNLDSLFADDEGFGMLDGLVYGEPESERSLVVTTDGLLDKWLIAHRDRWSKDNMPTAAAAAVKTEDFYTQAVNPDSAVAHYAELPVAAPPGAKFAHATLSLMGNGPLVPGAPDRIYLALEQNGRVFLVEEKLAIPVAPIAACDAAGADNAKRAEAADKAFMASGGKDKRLLESVETLRKQSDHAICACFAERVKSTAAFKAATDQAAEIIAALSGK